MWDWWVHDRALPKRLKTLGDVRKALVAEAEASLEAEAEKFAAEFDDVISYLGGVKAAILAEAGVKDEAELE